MPSTVSTSSGLSSLKVIWLSELGSVEHHARWCRDVACTRWPVRLSSTVMVTWRGSNVTRSVGFDGNRLRQLASSEVR